MSNSSEFWSFPLIGISCYSKSKITWKTGKLLGERCPQMHSYQTAVQKKRPRSHYLEVRGLYQNSEKNQEPLSMIQFKEIPWTQEFCNVICLLILYVWPFCLGRTGQPKTLMHCPALSVLQDGTKAKRKLKKGWSWLRVWQSTVWARPGWAVSQCFQCWYKPVKNIVLLFDIGNTYLIGIPISMNVTSDYDSDCRIELAELTVTVFSSSHDSHSTVTVSQSD